MRADSLFESVPNFSEGRRLDVVTAIAGATERAHLLDADPDPDHNRVVVSLAAYGPRLVEALLAATRVAIDTIDVRRHTGVHPRVGAADVLPIVPLDGASLADAGTLAHELGERIWSELHVPVYFYGHGTDRTLADIRAGRVRLDLGGPDLHPSAGAVCVGARGPLVAFNVILRKTDLRGARALAMSLRESGGGLRGVQALVFELRDGRIELSMNLFRLEEMTPAMAVAELERRGAVIAEQQLVGLCPAAAAPETAAGKLLEGRLAATAARAGARACLEMGDAEHTLLAGKLEGEADGLARTGVEQRELLAAAERAAAMAPVLRAARVLDAEQASMLRVAARGLRAAISSPTKEAYAARLDALDARLGSA